LGPVAWIPSDGRFYRLCICNNCILLWALAIFITRPAMQARGSVYTLATLNGSHSLSYKLIVLLNSNPNLLICVICLLNSRRAAMVTSRRQRSGFMVYRLSFFFSFYCGSNLSRYLSDCRIYFTDTRDMTRVFNSRLEFRKS
jgi:hypothetical protein